VNVVYSNLGAETKLAQGCRPGIIFMDKTQKKVDPNLDAPSKLTGTRCQQEGRTTRARTRIIDLLGVSIDRYMVVVRRRKGR
jgi:hypothetical protein